MLEIVRAARPGNSIMGSIFFCLSLNYKQMSLYQAPGNVCRCGKNNTCIAGFLITHSCSCAVFFFFLLRQCFEQGHGKLISTMKHVLKLGVTVAASFAVLWIPFCVFHAPDETC